MFFSLSSSLRGKNLFSHEQEVYGLYRPYTQEESIQLSKIIKSAQVVQKWKKFNIEAINIIPLAFIFTLGQFY